MSATGQWKIVIDSPMGKQEADLTLQQDGAALSGSISSPMFGTAELENASANGDTLTWTLNVTSPMPMALEGETTINGDSMTGTVKAGAFGAFPITGSRA